MARRPEPVLVLLRCGAEVARWPLPDGADLGMVEQLAAVQLAARRCGCEIVVRGAGERLVGLLGLCGLAGVLPCESAVEVVGQAEQREQLGVEEVVVPDDPVA